MINRFDKIFAVAITLSVVSGAAVCQTPFLPTLNNFSKTTPGGNAIVFAWYFAEASQVWRAQCGIERKPIDDAIESEIADIQDFIISHSSHDAVVDFRDSAAKIKQTTDDGLRDGTLTNYCKESNFDFLRGLTPSALQAATKSLLSNPPTDYMPP